MLSVSLTNTSIVTVSPGLAVTSGISQVTSPSYVSSIMIAPSIVSIFLVISRPFVSLTKRSLHETGYLPALMSSGTVYSTVRITAPSLAVVPLPTP